MRSPILDYLEKVIADTADAQGGETAAYIPELAQADPSRVAIALTTINGEVYSVGDADHLFSIPSMSKPFAYALAIEEKGLDYVLEHVGVEPSGDAFNELSLDPETGRPRNLMINAGAIATHSLLPEARVERIVEFMGRLAGRELEIDEAVASSELEHGSRNLGLAYLLDANGKIEGSPQDAVEGYIRQCAASVSVKDLSMMAATLANGGVNPSTGEQIFGRNNARQVLSVMTSCGMYDAAGDWLTTVGIPAKSGVAGGIIGVLPGQVGLAVFSPKLDSHGNSFRGVEMMKRLSDDMDLHLMESGRPARSAVRELRKETLEGEESTVYVLQGDLVLSSIEALTYEIITNPPEERTVVFDMSRVDDVMPVARRTSADMASKMLDEGYRIILVDPEDTIDGFTDSQGRDLEWWSVERLRKAQGLPVDV